MAANPNLLDFGPGALLPQLYDGEIPILRRDQVVFEVDNVRVGPNGEPGKWTAKGSIHLSSYRIVFIAGEGEAHPSGLRAFDLPLAYFRKEKVEQPILWGSNNIQAEVWPLFSGPTGTEPPFHIKISFPEGGLAVFVPLYLRVLETARNALYAEGSGRRPPSTAQVNSILNSVAFFDPNDPSKVFVEKRNPAPKQADPESKRLEESYLYAKEQDKDGESYAPLM